MWDAVTVVLKRFIVLKYLYFKTEWCGIVDLNFHLMNLEKQNEIQSKEDKKDQSLESTDRNQKQ